MEVDSSEGRDMFSEELPNVPPERQIVDVKCWRKPSAKEPPPAMISELMAGLRTDQEVRNFVGNGKRKNEVAVVQFGASWCHHCQQIFPAYYALSKQYRKIRFAVAHIDGLTEEAKHLLKTPTFSFYRDGKRIDEVHGADMDALNDRLWLHQDL